MLSISLRSLFIAQSVCVHACVRACVCEYLITYSTSEERIFGGEMRTCWLVLTTSKVHFRVKTLKVLTLGLELGFG